MLNFYENIYRKINSIVDVEELIKKQHIKFKSSGFMDLNFDFLERENDNSIKIAMAHNFIQDGDVICDPDMEIRIIPKMEMAEALTFQQDASTFPIYRRIYTERNGKTIIDLRVKKELNQFLNQWLSNIKKQDYILEDK